MDYPKLMTTAQNVLTALSWRKLARLSMLLLLLGASIAFWENREYLYSEVRTGKITIDKPPLKLSTSSERLINEVVRKSELVGAISVVTVNFQENSHSVIYMNTDDLDFARAHAEFTRAQLSTWSPLFNSDSDNNKRIIDLINGNMVCGRYEASSSYRYAPQVRFATTCALGVPPYYGQFRGFVTVYLRAVPTPDQMLQIRGALRDLSVALDYPR